ncbi:hypothetical protein UO65_0113 [Actinokineospora spheciospongiae]|uniref:FxLD family lantipeptide n=1 Tax=Actinokineospora spheciospongiae TaxID=909613 RepID=W7J659_9PSEU|nr:FxLD family lanthipeptide [Actinokineospora spheciospongiae]EWC64506.1 hypothetical protein UO65_0113 [Actinokineospora spheciospongiae]
MTVQLEDKPETTATAVVDSEFDLDVSIVESGPVVDELLRLTDDGCGATCESACNSCP